MLDNHMPTCMFVCWVLLSLIFVIIENECKPVKKGQLQAGIILKKHDVKGKE
jgi:hypothetical protein